MTYSRTSSKVSAKLGSEEEAQQVQVIYLCNIK